ncbi:lipoate-protein ligase B-like protein [Dinothrombium tinctorium]|uniref:Octanoyl-[acyl-carrier-protein]:protein N-octanoyltransferase LIPT2, mitochondrial n=1 Tax=Dinothrombium tinctorium TaxID=1965070 RepID=A0A3S3NSX6_9ACAR|nr:lipoate-protein ligase B-like protein [Dinothrombium tinctorium]
MSRVKVLRLGRKSFRETLRIQTDTAKTILEQLKSGVSQETVANTLILVEHMPVYTIGIRTKEYSSQTAAKLRSLGADFVVTDRGGLITFHGFGQLVAYPILYLGSFGNKSIKWYIHQLEKTVIDTVSCILKEIPVTVSTLDQYPGVWIDSNRKIAAIGVHAKRYVTTHGVAINCNTQMSWFDHIVPCGIEDKSVTSLSTESGREITIDQTEPNFLKAFQNVFKCELV